MAERVIGSCAWVEEERQPPSLTHCGRTHARDRRRLAEPARMGTALNRRLRHPPDQGSSPSTRRKLLWPSGECIGRVRVVLEAWSRGQLVAVDIDAEEAASRVGRHVQVAVATKAIPSSPALPAFGGRNCGFEAKTLKRRGPAGAEERSVGAIGHIDRTARIDGDVLQKAFGPAGGRCAWRRPLKDRSPLERWRDRGRLRAAQSTQCWSRPENPGGVVCKHR